jgi:hypothetical protein
MKPYRRGIFRVVKNFTGTGYWVQANSDTSGWVPIMHHDYLGSARLRVRNLHAACCSMVELAMQLPPTAQRYIKTGKLRKSKPSKKS